MIEKIPQSQGIMNAIHLQVKLRGADLERGHIVQILKTAQENANRLEAEEKKNLEQEHKNCEADLKNFQKSINENHKFEFTIGRHTAQNQRASAQLRTFIERTTAEKNDYEGLSSIIQDSWSKWQNLQKSTATELDKVKGLIEKARSELRKINTASTKGAFLELSENSQYFTNLNEIRVNFESTFVELQGFRPLITKLLQLMANTQAVNKEEVRTKLLALFKKIKGEIQNMSDEVEASKARQDAIFNALLEGYKENLTRIAKLLERLNKENTDLASDSVTLIASSKDSSAITSVAKDIFTTRKRECMNYIEAITKLAVEVERTRNIVAQLGEVLEERFGKLKTYFMQRETILLQKK